MAAIIVTNGEHEGLFLPLGKKTTVIGRDEALPLQIRDEKVSRKHLQIRFDPSDEKYHALDMKSANGLLINGRKVSSEIVLVDGDELQIGDTHLIFALQIPSDKTNALEVARVVGQRRQSTLIR